MRKSLFILASAEGIVIQQIEKLQQIIIENELPRTERAIFGLTCPYCGKSDRIRVLEPPQTIEAFLESSTLSAYQTIWQSFAAPGHVLGICRFCHYPLLIPPTGAHAVSLLANGD